MPVYYWWTLRFFTPFQCLKQSSNAYVTLDDQFPSSVMQGVASYILTRTATLFSEAIWLLHTLKSFKYEGLLLPQNHILGFIGNFKLFWFDAGISKFCQHFFDYLWDQTRFLCLVFVFLCWFTLEYFVHFSIKTFNIFSYWFFKTFYLSGILILCLHFTANSFPIHLLPSNILQCLFLCRTFIF